MVSTTIAVSGAVSVSAAIVSSPDPPGMPRSSTSTAGRCSATAATAPGKSPASPTTAIPSSASSRTRRPARTTAWSSASTTVIGSLIAKGLRGMDARRAGGGREGGQEGGGEDEDEDDRQLGPGRGEVQGALIGR